MKICRELNETIKEPPVGDLLNFVIRIYLSFHRVIITVVVFECHCFRHNVGPYYCCFETLRYWYFHQRYILFTDAPFLLYASFINTFIPENDG